jgi:hypothetical protein
VSDGDRFHRDDPRRAHPRRHMSGTFRSDDPFKMRPAPDEPGGFDEGEGLDAASREKARYEGVDEAYRIADQNMRGGQWRAGSRSQAGYDWRSAGYRDRSPAWASLFGPGYDSPFGYGYGERPFDSFLEQIIRTYMDMIGLVGTMINALARPAYPRPFKGRREPEFRYGADPIQSGRAAAIRIEVLSNQTNQIALDLKPLPPRVLLSVPPLRALKNGKPDLRDIRLDSESDRYVLRLRIPDEQPAGLYSGVIVETRSGEACGRLEIQVGRSAPDRARARSTKKSQE